MTYNKFRPGTLVEINGAQYLPHGYSGERLLFYHRAKGHRFECEQPNGSSALPTDEQFDQMLLDGTVVIRTPLSSNQIRNFNEESEWTIDDVAGIDDQALHRSELCEALDKHGVKQGNKAIEKALKEPWAAKIVRKFDNPPSPRTIRGWRSSRGYIGNRHPRHMVSLAGWQIEKVRKNDLNKQAMWVCVLEGLDEGHSVRSIHATYAAVVWQINEGTHSVIERPSKPLKIYDERTIRRACNALESSETLARRIAKQAAEQDWLGAGKPLTADFVMQRVIIDHTRLNAHVVCPKLEMVLGRPWLTLVIDVKSRAIVGYVITFFDPSFWTVGEAIRRMALPKRPPPEMVSRYPILAMLRGKASEVIVDNAVEFRSHGMEAAARHAGFSVSFCPIKQPRYRAICERAIQTMNNRLCNDLPGRTLTIHDARRFGYDAEEHAVVMLDELEAIANQVAADYNTSPHDGIGDRQPALIFEKDLNRYGINNFADFESFRRDTMDVVEGAQVSPSGLRAFGLRYHNIKAVPALLNDLVPLEPRRKRRDDATATVHFRYDPADISTIHVWNRKTRKYVELQCSDECYADGMPLWLHNKIKAEAKAAGAAFNTEEERLAMRGRLVQAVMSISPKAKAERRKQKAQMEENPRIRQITGNLVDLVSTNPEPVSLGDFISHDRAALTSLDHEILSPRPAPSKGQAKTALDHRREDVDPSQVQLPRATRARRNIAGEGGYA